MFDKKNISEFSEKAEMAMRDYESRFGAVSYNALNADLHSGKMRFLILSRGGMIGEGVEVIFSHEMDLENLTPASFYEDVAKAIAENKGPWCHEIAKGESDFEAFKAEFIGCTIGEHDYETLLTWEGLEKAVSFELEGLVDKTNKVKNILDRVVKKTQK